MRPMLVLVFGMNATTEECTALLIEIGDACGKSSLRLIVTNDPVRALPVLSEPELEVVHIVNKSNTSRLIYAGICELLADELEMCDKRPLVNLGDPSLRFTSAIFREHGLIPLETDLKSAVVRRWNELQTVPAT